MNNGDNFNYTYSAKQQEEVKRIRDKYTDNKKVEETPIEALRRLDGSVTKKASAAALVFGVIGTLVMGFGMSVVMSELGEALSLTGALGTAVGISVGLVGMMLVAAAYPIYCAVVRHERKRIAPEIIRLSDLLLK